MGHTPAEGTQHLAERWGGESAQRDAARVARRLDRTPLVDWVDRLDEGAGRDEFFHCLQAIGVMSLLEEAHGAAIPRELVPLVQDVWR